MNAASPDAAESDDPETRRATRREATGQSRRGHELHAIGKGIERSATGGWSRTLQECCHNSDDRPKERTGNQEREGREGQLQSDSHQERGVERGTPRDAAAVRKALDVLLQCEADHRHERNQPGRDRPPRPLPHAIETREEKTKHEADQREYTARGQLLEIAVPRLGKQCVRMGTRDNEIGQLVGEQGAQDHQRQRDEPGRAATNAGAHPQLAAACRHAGIRAELPHTCLLYAD